MEWSLIGKKSKVRKLLSKFQIPWLVPVKRKSDYYHFILTIKLYTLRVLNKAVTGEELQRFSHHA